MLNLLKACFQIFQGMSFTNTSPLVLPTRGTKPMLGTNPLTLAAPAKNKDSFVLDMATSAVALGKVRSFNNKESCIFSQHYNAYIIVNKSENWKIDMNKELC